jgi:molecular chaperone HscB
MTNYFELYDLPLSFHPDGALVKKKYYELSRQYHPDRFTQSAGAAMVEALHKSAQINDAFKTLRNPDETMAYILRLNNLLADEVLYNLPPDFLMEMMDLNEIVSELQPNDTASLQIASTSLNEQLQQWEAEVRQLTSRFDAGEQTKELLLKIKDYYFRKKYLLRIKERIDKFAAQ